MEEEDCVDEEEEAEASDLQVTLRQEQSQERDVRTYSTSPSRLDASDLMQDLDEFSNCAQRIDLLLDTPAADVSARLRRSISPAPTSMASSRRQSETADAGGFGGDVGDSDVD